MQRGTLTIASVLLIFALLSALAPCGLSPAAAKAQANLHNTPNPTQATPDPHYSPAMFIENAGQWPDRARFQARGGPAAITWLAQDAIWLTVVEPRSGPSPITADLRRAGSEPRPWRARGEEGIVLRAALKSRHDAEWVGFASLEALVAALRAQMEQEDRPIANGQPQAENDA